MSEGRLLRFAINRKGYREEKRDILGFEELGIFDGERDLSKFYGSCLRV